MTLDYIARTAQLAEAARFDAIFLADKVCRDGTDLMQLEPLTTLGALSAVTSRIGLVATVSTSFSEPYNAARAKCVVSPGRDSEPAKADAG